MILGQSCTSPEMISIFSGTISAHSPTSNFVKCDRCLLRIQKTVNAFHFCLTFVIYMFLIQYKRLIQQVMALCAPILLQPQSGKTSTISADRICRKIVDTPYLMYSCTLDRPRLYIHQAIPEFLLPALVYDSCLLQKTKTYDAARLASKSFSKTSQIDIRTSTFQIPTHNMS